MMKPVANIYPLHLHPKYLPRQRWRELKNTFLVDHLDFVLWTLNAAERCGGPSPQGVQVLERASELLRQARESLMQEVREHSDAVRDP